MNLPLLNSDSLLSLQAAAMQAQCPQLTELSEGSPLLAFAQPNTAVALQVQWITLLLLSIARAATSNGPDLDSFMADFGLTRVQGVAASGQVTFSRASPMTSALVPIGATVASADLTLTFTVIEDTTNAYWNAAQNGYLIPAGTASATFTVQCSTIGSVGNVGANTISLMTSDISGVDSVNNALAFGNGVDVETDADFRVRFQNYINTRSLATVAAIEYAISGVQANLSYSVRENIDATGATSMGNFIVVVDDGTGNPSSTLLSEVYAAVDAVRPLGSTFGVFPPIPVSVTISMSITMQSGYDKSAAQTAIANGIETYIETLGLGGTLPYSRIAAIAYDASLGVANITGITVNGSTADITSGPTSKIVISSVTVN